MRKLLMMKLVGLLLVGSAAGQSASKVQDFAHAIAKAEGFYTRGTIPNRYSNPGDLKARAGEKYPGQKGIGKGGHVIFRNDAAGWAALTHQIEEAVSGDSQFYNPSMTFRQVAKKYAGNYRVWLKNVTGVLGVDADMSIYDYMFNLNLMTLVADADPVFDENFNLLAFGGNL
jgi:hypothetical protein